MKRWIALLLCAVLLAGMIVPASAALPEEAGLTAEEWRVLLLTNRERLKGGLDPLTTTDFLQEVGDVRADEITVHTEHERPDGTDCFTALDEDKHPFFEVGENIAAGQRSPEEVVESWMNSSGHRANIMHKSFRHMGAGYAQRNAGYGKYWVQFFFTGVDCDYTAMWLVGGNAVPAGCKTIDDAQLMLAVQCGCGTSYLPLMQEFCTGFDPNTAGPQTLTVSCLGFTMQLEVNVGGPSTIDPNEPPKPVKPTQPTKPNEPSQPAQPTGFVDVAPDAWYADAVRFAVQKGLMNGVGSGEFDPEGSMTRAMLVTVLWRRDDSPAAGVNRFTDVPNGQWYTPAVTWAQENGIVNGTSETTFDPNASITREQMAAILFRYAKYCKADTSGRDSLNAFPDASAVSDYAREAVAWTVAGGIIGGSDGLLLPQGDATRAQVAAILMRYIQNFLSASNE